MINDQDLYGEMRKLFKFLLLLLPRMKNVERGFSVLKLLVIKLRSSNFSLNVNQLMRLVFVGLDQISDEPGNYWLIVTETVETEGLHCNISTILFG